MTTSLFGLNNYFYHGTIRKYVALFGSLFTDIHIKRTAGDKEDIIQVPIRYGNGNMYSKAPQDSQSRDAGKHARILPAMAFTLDNFYKDVQRKTNGMNRITASVANDDGTRNLQLNRIPYNFVFNLKIITKNTDDMLQIAEQIIPCFDTNLSVTIQDTTGVDLEQDIIISLQEVETEDNYDDEMKGRLIEWTITFELKGFMYKRTKAEYVIKEIDIIKGIQFGYMPETDVILPTPNETQTNDLMITTSEVFDSQPIIPIKKVTRKRTKKE